MRALSIRQPYAEQILRGTKTIEYPSRQTNVRERVYIYAAMSPAVADAWAQIKLRPGDLPTGVRVGTVEITDFTGVSGAFGKASEVEMVCQTNESPAAQLVHPFRLAPPPFGAL